MPELPAPRLTARRPFYLTLTAIASVVGGMVAVQAKRISGPGGVAVLIVATGLAFAALGLGLVFSLFTATRVFGLSLVSLGLGLGAGFWVVVFV